MEVLKNKSRNFKKSENFEKKIEKVKIFCDQKMRIFKKKN